jgi:DNA repair protein RadD
MSELDPIVNCGVSLYPYQNKAVADFCTARDFMRRILIVAPTGSGKTVIGSAIMKIYADLFCPVLVLAHRREIIAQTHKKLADHGVNAGIIQAGHPVHPMRLVQVASLQTLHARTRREVMQLPPAKLVVIDEAHHAPAQTYRKVMEAYPDAVILGLTATPCRGDGRGLGADFDCIIEAPQVEELIGLGRLVRPRYYAPTKLDLAKVHTRAGDYVESELAERMDRPQLIGDIVGHWIKYGERRKTVVFAVNVQHSIHLRDEFVRLGVKAEHIDGSTPKDERDAILKRLETGEIEVVTNCMVLTEGWDMPEVGCCVLARPTKQIGLYRQMVGRVLRGAPGKTDAIVIDHSGAVDRLGLAEDEIEWTLAQDRVAENLTQKQRKRDGVEPIVCRECGALRHGGLACLECGFKPERQGKAISVIDGDLGLVTADRKVSGREYSQSDRISWIAQLKYIAQERSYKDGWVYHQYLNKFNSRPPVHTSGVPPAPPTPEVRSWVRSRQIAYAKSRGRAA